MFRGRDKSRGDGDQFLSLFLILLFNPINFKVTRILGHASKRSLIVSKNCTALSTFQRVLAVHNPSASSQGTLNALALV